MPAAAGADRPAPNTSWTATGPPGLDGGWLRAAVLAATRATLAALPPGDHCGYALHSDDGAMTVCCAVNTVGTSIG